MAGLNSWNVKQVVKAGVQGMVSSEWGTEIVYKGLGCCQEAQIDIFRKRFVLATVWRAERPGDHEEVAAGGFMRLMGVKGIEFTGFSFQFNVGGQWGKGLGWVSGFCIS